MPGSASSPRVAVLAHGSGSTGDFVTRALRGPLGAAGWSIDAIEDRSGSVTKVEEAVAAAVRSLHPGLVAGVSLGAHAVARWAAHHPEASSILEGLVLLLPAWTGAPGCVAALSSAAADHVERSGVSETLGSLKDGSWVSEELERAWPSYGEALVPALRATAASPGPTLDELSRIRIPVGVVAFTDDPFHPVEIARAWSAALPRAGLVELARDAPALDREVLGRAALAAWDTARAGS